MCSEIVFLNQLCLTEILSSNLIVLLCWLQVLKPVLPLISSVSVSVESLDSENITLW